MGVVGWANLRGFHDGFDQKGQSGALLSSRQLGDRVYVQSMFNFFGNQDMAGMVQSLLQEAGGLQGVKGKLESAGLGEAVMSWIGTGANSEVDAEQLADALGRDKLEGLAAKSGIDLQKVIPLLAAFLPLLIDKLTPDGDEAGADDRINDRDNLDGLLGDVLKGGLGRLFG